MTSQTTRTTATQILLATATLLAATPAFAAVSLVSSRASLGGDDAINWAIFGNPGSFISSGATGFTNASALFTLNTELFTIRQWNGAPEPFTGWAGHFGPSARGVFASSTFDISFTNPIAAGGAQIDSNSTTAYTVRIEALDSNGDSLGFLTTDVTRSGTFDGPDNAAPFVGIASDQPNISTIRINITNTTDGSPDGFGLNDFDIRTNVPSPAAATLAGLTLLTTAARRRTR